MNREREEVLVQVWIWIGRGWWRLGSRRFVDLDRWWCKRSTKSTGGLSSYGSCICILYYDDLAFSSASLHLPCFLEPKIILSRVQYPFQIGKKNCVTLRS